MVNTISNSSWTEQELSYEGYRKKLICDVPSIDVADAPFVFARRQAIAQSLTRIKLFDLISDVKGSIVECGVHRGNNLFLLSHLSSIMEPYAFNRKVIGFDTFEGFQSLSDKDDPILSSNDFANTDYDRLVEFAQLNDKNRPVGHIPKLELVKGDAVQTIPRYVEEHPELLIALLYLDFDIYEPTRVALEHLRPLVVRGGIIAFDELASQKWQGETMAFKEAFNVSSVRLRKFPFEPWMSYFVVE